MKSLRGMVLVGAGLWTVGLLAIWAVSITLNRNAIHSVVLVHSYPHTLGIIARGRDAGGVRHGPLRPEAAERNAPAPRRRAERTGKAGARALSGGGAAAGRRT